MQSDWKLRTEFLAFFLHAADRTALEHGGALVRDAILDAATTLAAQRLVSSTFSRTPDSRLPKDWEHRVLEETIRNIAAADADYSESGELLPGSDEAMLQALLGRDRTTVLSKLADAVTRGDDEWDRLLVIKAATRTLLTTGLLHVVAAEAEAQRATQVRTAFEASRPSGMSVTRSPWERPRGD